MIAKQQCFDVQLKNVVGGNIYDNFQNFWFFFVPDTETKTSVGSELIEKKRLN